VRDLKEVLRLVAVNQQEFVDTIEVNSSSRLELLTLHCSQQLSCAELSFNSLSKVSCD
jgi:hypothetical protein